MEFVIYFQESILAISDISQLQIIDGQQRFTNVSILFAALPIYQENKTYIENTSYKTPTKLLCVL